MAIDGDSQLQGWNTGQMKRYYKW